MHNLIIILLTLALCSCTNNKVVNPASPKQTDTFNLDKQKLANANLEIFRTDTTIISGKTYVYNIFSAGENSFFVVKKLVKDSFKTILKEPVYYLNHSELSFEDVNGDRLNDLVWHRKWVDQVYLFNPKIENFAETGEVFNAHNLIINNKPILYKNKYPILYLWNDGKMYQTNNCSADTLIQITTSDLFYINDDYIKVQFAILGNHYYTAESRAEMPCGAQIITCYKPQYDKNGNFKEGPLDSFIIAKGKADYSFENSFGIDSNFIERYWQRNYKKYLDYATPYKRTFDGKLEYLN